MAAGGLFAKLLRIPGKVLGVSGKFGDFAAKYGVGANRFKHFEDAKTFRNVKGKNKSIATRVVTENEQMIDDAFLANKSKTQSIDLMSEQLDEAGIVLTDAKRRNLAKLIIEDGMEFTRKTNRVSKFASAGGTLTILGVGAVVGGAIADWINSKLGGMLSGLLNPASESTLGSMIVLGVVVIGSVYILNTTKQVLGS